MSSLSIRVEGLAETLKGLREIDRELPKEVKRGLREDVRPLFAAYQSYARSLGGSGQYAANASMRTISARTATPAQAPSSSQTPARSI